MSTWMVIAGEDSGDMHAAEVVRELKKRCPGSTFFGIGGERLRGEGVELLHDVPEMDVMGFVEVLRRYPFFRSVFKEMIREAERRRPDGVLLVDYPGFNLRLAGALKRRGIRVFYYICPQVWAWNRGRIPKMAERIDRLMVIFPFEVEVFRGVRMQTDFVGHPMVDELREFRSLEAEPLPWGAAGKRIALLPGSRRQEIHYILPRLLETAALIEKTVPDVSFLIPVPLRRMDQVNAILQRSPCAPKRVFTVAGAAREALKQADAAFVASGTATLEAALLRCPTVLVYRGSWINYLLARALIRIPRVGIVNIVMGREVMPERLQRQMRPIELAAALDPLLNDTPQRRVMLGQFDELERLLDAGRPAGRIADILAKEIAGDSSLPG